MNCDRANFSVRGTSPIAHLEYTDRSDRLNTRRIEEMEALIELLEAEN